MDRVQDQLRAGQRRFVRLLPALLSLNHADLPGYVGGAAPGGIQGYMYDSAIRDELASRFNAHIKPAHHIGRTALINLSLMGSIGSLGHGPESDLDLWAIHRPGLSLSDQQSLQRRLEGIQRWGQSLGLRVQCFLINPEAFADQPQQPTIPHALLLDEYLRTATVLAGGLPTAWLVPPEQDDQIDRLADIINAQLPRDRQTVNFGPLAMPPPEALVEFALSQIAASIDSPWKALLKLNLAIRYAEGNAEPLSHDHRRALVADYAPTDPYLALFNSIDGDLDEVRQNLTRRALYLKSGIRLSHPSLQTPAWQHRMMAGLAKTWRWSDAQIQQIDHAAGWPIAQIQALHRQLMQELTRCFQRMTEICQWQGIRPSGDHRLDKIARQLYARFEAKPGKLEQFHPTLLAQLQPQNADIQRLDAGRWEVRAPGASWFFYSHCQAAAWCLHNGLHLQEEVGPLDQLFQGAVNLDFSLPAEPQRLLWVGEPQVKTGAGLSQLTSAQVLTRNPWGEIQCRHYACVEHMIIDGLPHLLGRPDWIAACDLDYRASADWDQWLGCLMDMADFFNRPDFAAGRYVVQIDGVYLAIEFHENQVRCQSWPTLDAMIEALAAPANQFRRTEFAQYCEVPAGLRYVCEHAVAGQILWWIDERERLWASDERGSVVHWHIGSDHQLQHWYDFTHRVLERRGNALLSRFNADQTPEIQILRDSDGVPSVLELRCEPGDPTRGLSVQGHWTPWGELAFEWGIGGCQISELSHGPDYLTHVVEQVLSTRAERVAYPIHIADMTLPRLSDPWGVQPMQTSQYWTHKLALEEAIVQENG